MSSRPSLILAATLTLALLGGCAEDDDPEQRVRAFIDQVAASAEARAWSDFNAYLAVDYSDNRGLTRREALGVVTRYLLAHRSIHVFQRVRQIEVRDPRHARALVLAALAGSPVAGPDDLARLDADLYRFEIELADEGDGFRVTSATWQPVGLEALLTAD
jgi:hypothetical protein